MAWGTKVVRFDNGEKVKIGNAVLEEIHAAIIRDYLTTTKDATLKKLSQYLENERTEGG